MLFYFVPCIYTGILLLLRRTLVLQQLLQLLFFELFTYNNIFRSCSVRIKTFAAFYAKFARSNHVYQQRAWCIFWISKTFVQYIKNTKTNIKTNKICKLQWSHRVRHSKLHNGIYFVNAGNAFV